MWCQVFDSSCSRRAGGKPDELMMRDQKVSIQSATETQNDSNELVKSWSTSSTAWVHIRGLRGWEMEIADQEVALQTYKVFALATSATEALTPEDRLLWGSKVLGIEGVDLTEVRSKQKVVLTCRELVD